MYTVHEERNSRVHQIPLFKFDFTSDPNLHVMDMSPIESTNADSESQQVSRPTRIVHCTKYQSLHLRDCKALISKITRLPNILVTD